MIAVMLAVVLAGAAAVPGSGNPHVVLAPMPTCRTATVVFLLKKATEDALANAQHYELLLDTCEGDRRGDTEKLGLLVAENKQLRIDLARAPAPASENSARVDGGGGGEDSALWFELAGAGLGAGFGAAAGAQFKERPELGAGVIGGLGALGGAVAGWAIYRAGSWVIDLF